jgi:hypothetical protein
MSSNFVSMTRNMSFQTFKAPDQFGNSSKAIKDARHTQPAAPSATAGVVDRRMPDARVAGTVMGI